MKRFFGPGLYIGLAVSLVVFLMSLLGPSWSESIELKLYDLRLRLSPKSEIADDIRLVDIDEASIANYGRWPWPRSHIARIIERLSAAKARAIGLNIVLSEPEQNQGLEEIQQLSRDYEDLVREQRDILKPLIARLKKDPRYRRDLKDDPFEGLEGFSGNFRDAEEQLDTDGLLEAVLDQTPRLVMPYLLRTLDKPAVEEASEEVEKMRARALLQSQVNVTGDVLEGFVPLLPLERFIKNTGGMGNATVAPDLDGTIRRVPLIMEFRGQYHPSLALEMARVALNIPIDKVQVTLGKEIKLGDRTIPLDSSSQLLVDFQGPFSKFPVISAGNLLREENTPNPEGLKNKIFLIGPTAAGIGNVFVTPLDPVFQNSGLHLAALQNILEGKFISRPPWAPRAELAWLLFAALVVILLLPRVKPWPGLAMAGALLAVTLAGGIYLFVTKGWWIKITYPSLLVGVGYVAINIYRLYFAEKGKELGEAQSALANRQLGLSFQTQGLLDMAYEKFQKVPVDEEMKGLLYNLALDFERKRQFNKAVVVYEHIAAKDPNFKDIKERSKSMKQAGETMIAGAGLGSSREGGTIAMAGGAAKPTLGRYEIQKELGRGAMGVVYLGKDPKINRAVAIKTLRFGDDMDPETAKFTKDRFFREAESAGTLNHPHIIRIYDAGEDGEISYIAMELLDGEDLKKYVEKANLLEVPMVVEYIAQIADALDYAHSNGVVHRDIKPANIMRLKDGTLRVTDFGIARITASSKTSTGTVLGTPSYMSPEQLAGKKVDGRSDLFSLGVMLYEMLTGEKPFEGESIATLLFKIANEPHPDPRLKRTDRVSAALKSVIDRALEKNPDRRYQRGGEMMKDLRAALVSPEKAIAKPAESALAGTKAPDEPTQKLYPEPTAGETAKIAPSVKPGETPAAPSQSSGTAGGPKGAEGSAAPSQSSGTAGGPRGPETPADSTQKIG